MFFPFILGIGTGIYIDQRFNIPDMEPMIKSFFDKIKENEKQK